MPLSMDRWISKVAIVTGAGSGIGAAIAEALVEEGVWVVGLEIHKDRVDALAKKLENKKGRFYPFEADVSKEEDILRAFKWTIDGLGPIHILVNNAGVATNTNLMQGDTQLWRKVLDVNVMGLSIATREAVKNMRENNVDGHIIHINSIFGHKIANFARLNMYGASKHAVTALTETLRNELNSVGSKIKITGISPGFVKTNIMNAAGFDDVAELLKKMKMLEPQDIADGAIYVLSTPPHVQVLGLDLIKDRVDEVSRKLLDKKGKFYPFEADVTKEDNIIRAFEWTKENLGPIHILVNNAGIYTNQTLLEGDTKEWKRLLDTNVMAACIATREAVKNMRENNVDGHIIDINSLAGHKVPSLPTMNLYAASKHAITALVETLRNELSSIGSKIKITSISPGTVKTNIASAAGIQMPPEVIGNLPMLEPRDIADGVIYALSTPSHVQVHELTIRPVGEQF